ncbi:MAG: hypothetical protein Q9218_001527 [Villophora microphyllina]
MLLNSSNVFTPLALLLVLSATTATKIENILQYRQNIPIGTGVSTSAAPKNSLTPANPVSSAAAQTPLSVNPTVLASTTVAAQTVSDTSNDSPSISTTTGPQSTTRASNQGPTSTANNPVVSGTGSTTTSTLDAGSTDASTASTQTRPKSVSSRTQQFLTTIVTKSGISTLTNVFTTSGLVPVSTSTGASTSTPTLDTNESGSSKSGLNSSQKRIIIGVVVGIGGAILLGGIAVVAWRVWGRKGRSSDGNNDLTDSHPGSSGREKRSSISGQSPFRSTLDQYHHQTGPVNTASNF